MILGHVKHGGPVSKMSFLVSAFLRDNLTFQLQSVAKKGYRAATTQLAKKKHLTPSNINKKAPAKTIFKNNNLHWEMISANLIQTIGVYAKTNLRLQNPTYKLYIHTNTLTKFGSHKFSIKKYHIDSYIIVIVCNLTDAFRVPTTFASKHDAKVLRKRLLNNCTVPRPRGLTGHFGGDKFWTP